VRMHTATESIQHREQVSQSRAEAYYSQTTKLEKRSKGDHITIGVLLHTTSTYLNEQVIRPLWVHIPTRLEVVPVVTVCLNHIGSRPSGGVSGYTDAGEGSPKLGALYSLLYHFIHRGPGFHLLGAEKPQPICHHAIKELNIDIARSALDGIRNSASSDSSSRCTEQHQTQLHDDHPTPVVSSETLGSFYIKGMKDCVGGPQASAAAQ
jgi:hypothetical protein